MDPYVSTAELLLRLGIAVLLGGLLGWEREWHHKPAGLRTHIMVALGSATFTVVTFELYEQVVEDSPEAARVDPVRIVSGVIGGIGFLGAGAIIQGRGSVRGLTTAGSIWIAGAVGVACGGGHYLIASLSTGMALFALVILGLIKSRFSPKDVGNLENRRDPERR